MDTSFIDDMDCSSLDDLQEKYAKYDYIYNKFPEIKTQKFTDDEDDIVKQRELLKKVANYISIKHKDCMYVLNNYSLASYDYINQFLLTKKNRYTKIPDKQIEEKIKKIDNCFIKSAKTTDNTLILYRGMDKDIFPEIGMSIPIKNYISASTDKNVAIGFMKGDCFLYCLHVDKNIPFIDMDLYSFAPNENEILLPRDLIMTFTHDEEQIIQDSTIHEGKLIMIKKTVIMKHVNITLDKDQTQPIDQQDIAGGKKHKNVRKTKRNVKGGSTRRVRRTKGRRSRQ